MAFYTRLGLISQLSSINNQSEGENLTLPSNINKSINQPFPPHCPFVHLMYP